MKPLLPPLPRPIRQPETFPAFVVGKVRDTSDFHQTVADVVAIGLEEDLGKRNPRFGQFAGHVATADMMTDIRNHPDVEYTVPQTVPMYAAS